MSFSYVTKPSSYQQFGSSKVGPSSKPNQNSYPRWFTDQNQAVYSSMQRVSSWGGDEKVDEKATSFISYVRERLLGEC